jgi:hypothetical protein
MTIILSLVALIGDPSGNQQARSHRSAREQQWLYRDALADGSAKPVAVFLAWDYSEVVFTATCDQQTREVVLRSSLEHGPHAPPFEPLEISSNHGTVKLRTEVRDGYVEGRTKVTAALRRVLQTNGDLEVFVPSEMGEPLYVGRAQPLRRIGLGCMP